MKASDGISPSFLIISTDEVNNHTVLFRVHQTLKSTKTKTKISYQRESGHEQGPEHESNPTRDEDGGLR